MTEQPDGSPYWSAKHKAYVDGCMKRINQRLTDLETRITAVVNVQLKWAEGDHEMDANLLELGRRVYKLERGCKCGQDASDEV